MDFSLSDHQKLIRDTVRQFMENEVRPGVRQRDREGRFPTAELKKIAELGCCGMTLWNQLRAWQRAGVWERLHHALLQHLADAGKLDWRRASADASRIPAKGVKKGAPRPGRTRPTGASRERTTIWWPTDRAPRWPRSAQRPT